MGQAMHCKLLPSFTSSNIQQKFSKTYIESSFLSFLKKKKQLFSATQSGFCSNDSFENLLPSTAHRIYTNISLQRFWIRIWSKSLEDFL